MYVRRRSWYFSFIVLPVSQLAKIHVMRLGMSLHNGVNVGVEKEGKHRA